MSKLNAVIHRNFTLTFAYCYTYYFNNRVSLYHPGKKITDVNYPGQESVKLLCFHFLQLIYSRLIWFHTQWRIETSWKLLSPLCAVIHFSVSCILKNEAPASLNCVISCRSNCIKRSAILTVRTIELGLYNHDLIYFSQTHNMLVIIMTQRQTLRQIWSTSYKNWTYFVSW